MFSKGHVTVTSCLFLQYDPSLEIFIHKSTTFPSLIVPMLNVDDGVLSSHAVVAESRKINSIFSQHKSNRNVVSILKKMY